VYLGSSEVAVNRRAAEAVLRGADVFVPGVLAASRGLAPGQLVAVTAALELPGRHVCVTIRGCYQC
jgi:methyltransferase NSUN6